MKVLILGAGKVGGSLATALVNNNYDVSIVDQNINLLSELEEKLDIIGFAKRLPDWHGGDQGITQRIINFKPFKLPQR